MENNNFWFCEKIVRGRAFKILSYMGEAHSRKRSFFAVYSLIMHILKGKGWDMAFSFFNFFNSM